LNLLAASGTERVPSGGGDILGFEPFDLGFGAFQPIEGTLEVDVVLQFASVFRVSAVGRVISGGDRRAVARFGVVERAPP